MALGNTPRRETNIALEASKSYVLGLQFRDASDKPIDLDDSIVRIVVAEGSRAGHLEVLSKEATYVGGSLGLVQFRFQAQDLALDPGSYPYDVTLVAASGFSTPVLKGYFEIGPNADADDSNQFEHIFTGSDISVIVEQGDLIEIRIERVDGLFTLAEQMILDFNETLEGQTAVLDAAVVRATQEADRSGGYASELRAWMAAVGFPFWQGTQAQYDNIPAPDPLILYLIVDEGVLP